MVQWAIPLTSNDEKSGSGVGRREGWGEEYTWEPNCNTLCTAFLLYFELERVAVKYSNW